MRHAGGIHTLCLVRTTIHLLEERVEETPIQVLVVYLFVKKKEKWFAIKDCNLRREEKKERGKKKEKEKKRKETETTRTSA